MVDGGEIHVKVMGEWDVRALSRANVMRVCQLSVSNNGSSTARSSTFGVVAMRMSTLTSF